jgi:hypothetical protein
VALTTHLHLATGLKKEHSYPILPLWDFVGCPRVKFNISWSTLTTQKALNAFFSMWFQRFTTFLYNILRREHKERPDLYVFIMLPNISIFYSEDRKRERPGKIMDHM